MGAVGKAGGKLLLFGEHAAVYGHLAVGVSLPEQTTVRLQDSPRPGWDLGPVAEEDRSTVSRVLARMDAAAAGMGLTRGSDETGRSVSVHSRLPRGLGFGSSAALCVACARALLADRGGAPEETQQAWTLAHDAERLFHGKPSGVDTGIAVLAGTCVLQPRPGMLPDYRQLPARGVVLVAAAVRRDESCADLIRGLAERMQARDPRVTGAIEELGRLSRRAAEVLESTGSGPAQELGALADAAMRALCGLGLCTPELDLLCRVSRAAGARGGKLSGGGGGGAFYAVAPDQEAAARIADRIREESRAAGVALRDGPRILLA